MSNESAKKDMKSGFRLISIYVEEFGYIKNKLLNFCSDYIVEIKNLESGLHITVNHKPSLPTLFFTCSTPDDKCDCVRSVSAIVGKNASGKTTVARLLCNIARAGNEKKDWKVVLIYEQGGKPCVWTTMQLKELKVLYVKANGEYCPIDPPEQNNSSLPFRLIYFSPHFTTEQLDTYTVGYHGNRQIGEEGKVCTDISTTWLMHHPEGNSELLLEEGISQTAIYDADEKIRVFEFIAAWQEKVSDGKLKDDFQIPKPQGASIGINVEQIKYAIRKWEYRVDECRQEESGPQKRIRTTMKDSPDELSDPVGEFYRTILEPFKNAVENIASNGYLQAVFLAYAAEYILDCGIEHVPISLNLKEDPYVRFLYALNDFISKWNWKTSCPQDKEIISFFEEHRPTWPLTQQDSSQNYSKRLFELIQAFLPSCVDKLESVSLDTKSNIVNCRLDEARALKQVCELVRLHRLTHVISPYLKFDVLPHMSSGEMAFLSLFARLYHFVGKLNENENIVVFLDEAETTLHPEWQQRLVAYCIRFFEIFLPGRQYQLVFSSHSPMLLSDLPKGNIVFLGKNQTKDEKCLNGRSFDGATSNTFAANIFDLYKDSFFLQEGTMGEFAKGKVDALLKKLNPPKPDTSNMSTEEIMKAAEEYQQKLRGTKIDPENDLMVANLIGDPFLSRYIWRRLEELNKDYDTPEDEQGGEGNGDRS